MLSTPRFLFLALCAAAFMVFLSACKRSRALTPADMAGIWRVDRGFAPNSANPPLPDSYYGCTLTLKSDGTFIAANVPPDFFHSASHLYEAPEYRGTWKVEWAGAENSVHLNFPGPNGAYSALVQERTGKHGICIERDSSHPAFYMTKSDPEPHSER